MDIKEAPTTLTTILVLGAGFLLGSIIHGMVARFYSRLVEQESGLEKAWRARRWIVDFWWVGGILGAILAGQLML